MRLEVINKQVERYVSQIFELPKVQEFMKIPHSFLIILGGKGVGKSHLGFNKMMQHISKGQSVAYMRNSLVEIQQVKHAIANQIIEETQFKNLRVSDQNITDKDTNRIICNFVTPKNYNKIAGNRNPHYFLFYDEFNQIISNDVADLTTNFWTILQTLFRTEKFNVVACGNTNTTNNVLFNLFKIELPPIEHNIELFNDEDYVTIVRYLPTAFKSINMDTKDLEMIKKLNPLLYQEQMVGNYYHESNDLVLNRINQNEWQPLDYYLIYKARVYQIFTHKDADVWLIQQTDNRLSLTWADNQSNKIYDLDDEYQHLTSHVSNFYDSSIALKIKKKLKQQQIFFDGYGIYTWIVQTLHQILDESFASVAE